MKIDERIIDGALPFTLYDTDKAKEYLNDECYFSSNLNDFIDVKRYCSVGRLVDINDNDKLPFKISGCVDCFFEYCLPCKFVVFPEDEEKEIERPFTLSEFKTNFKYLDTITIRKKTEPNYVITGAFIGYEEIDGGNYYLAIGGRLFTLEILHELYEYREFGEWKPFTKKGLNKEPECAQSNDII